MLENKMNVSLTQNMKLNPQMIQSIKILGMTRLELSSSIQQELTQNPALEIVEQQETVESISDPPLEEDEEFPNEENEYSESKSSDLEKVLSRPETLHEHLLWQLRLQSINEALFSVGASLIENLDEDGFYLQQPEALFSEVTQDMIDAALHIVQALDPIGTCVADYKESLKVQARIKGNAPPHINYVIEHLFDPHQDIAALKEEEGKEEFVQCLEYLKTLSPFPGRQYATEQARYAIPDASIYVKANELIVLPNDAAVPMLTINNEFERILHASQSRPDTLAFVKKHVHAAKEFIRSIQLREHTSLKIIQAIVTLQREFFFSGPTGLLPLTLREVAAHVDMSESTVSRISTSRFVQTTWGLYPLKFFFASGIKGVSRNKIEDSIKEIIANHEGNRLSDQGITDILAAQGIQVARRTVAKYRKLLHTKEL